MTTRALLALPFLVACGGTAEHVAVPDRADAALTDSPSEAESDAGIPDAAPPVLCCRTGASLFPCDPAGPWACALYADSGVWGECGRAIGAGLCGLGAACQDDFGAGTVVACGP